MASVVFGVPQKNKNVIFLQRGMEREETDSPTSPTLLIAKKIVPAMTSTSPSRGFEPPERSTNHMTLIDTIMN